MTRKWFSSTVLIVFFSLLCTAVAWAFEETTIKNFLVKEEVALSVSSIQGKVAVEGHRESIVNMVASKSVREVPEEKARELLSQVEVKVEAGEDAIRIATTPLNTASISLLSLPAPRVDYLLAVPYRSRASIETVNGEIRITNLENEIKARAVSGKIIAQGLAGDVNLETVSGKITVERLLGNLTARTVSGDIRVDVFPGKDFFELRISSVSGNVLIFVPEGEGIEIFAETVSEKFSSEIPLEIDEESSPGWRIFHGKTKNVPRKTISVKTISGNISIKTTGRKLTW